MQHPATRIAHARCASPSSPGHSVGPALGSLTLLKLGQKLWLTWVTDGDVISIFELIKKGGITNHHNGSFYF